FRVREPDWPHRTESLLGRAEEVLKALPTSDLPDDPALPALAAIRGAGLAATFPLLGLDDQSVQFRVLRYHPGRRAAIEVRAGPRRFALKACAEDPAPEAGLHEALAAAGLADDSGARVPR